MYKRQVVNTVPALVIREPMIREMHSDAVIIDIASRPGGTEMCIRDRTGSYAYLAHPDLMNYQGMDSVYDWEMTRVCKEMKERDIPLEINRLGMGEGSRHYPAERFWKIAGKVGNKAILGLDAHCVRHIQDVDSYRMSSSFISLHNRDVYKRQP